MTTVDPAAVVDPAAFPESDTVLDVDELDDAEDLTMSRLTVIDDLWDDDPLVESAGSELSDEVDAEMQP
jgi:hypothetical protein